MKFYYYKEVGSTGTSYIPQNTHLIVETDSAGTIYMVPTADQTLIVKSTDKGLTFATVKNATSNITALYHDRNQEHLYYVHYLDTTLYVRYLDLTDDSDNQVENIGIITGICFDTYYYDSKAWILNTDEKGDGKTYLQSWDATTPAVNQQDMGAFAGRTSDATFTTLIGDDIWFLWQWSNEDAELWKYDHSGTSFSQLAFAGGGNLTGASIDSDRNLCGIAYDGSDVLYFVLDVGGTDTLYSYSIGTDTVASVCAFSAAIMLERNTASGVIEKAFDISNDNIYKLHRARGSFLKLAEIVMAANATKGITDNFLFTDEEKVYEYKELTADNLDSCEIDYKMGNITIAKFSVTDDLPILTTVEFFDPSDVLLFQGLIVEKIYTDTNIYKYRATSYDSEILSYKFSDDQTAGDTDAAAIIENILDSADWLYYSGSITSPAINIKADFNNISFKDFMDTMCDRTDYIWYVAPDGKVYFNDGTTASGNAVSHTSGIMSEPKIKLIGSQINKIVLYGGYVDGARITAISEDAAAQKLYGVIEYIDHFPHITNQTELDALAVKIRSRSGMDDNPYYVDVELYGQEFIQCANTIDFTFTPLSFTQDDLILLSYKYDAKADQGKYKLTTGIIQNLWRGYGVFDKKTKTADEEQLDILGGIIEESEYTDADAVSALATVDKYLKNDANDETTGDLTVANLITAGLVDGQDVAAMATDLANQATAAEAHAYVEANALTLTQNVTFNAGQTFDGKDVSTLGTDAEAKTYIEANTKLDDLQSPNDNTDLDSSNIQHGLMPKLSGNANQFLDGSNTWRTPSYTAGDTYMATGTYTGNAANNREITGLGFNPTHMILIAYINVGATWIMQKNTNHAQWEITYTHNAAGETNTLDLIVDGFEVNNNHASDTGNVNNRTYYWVAWG